MPNGDGTTRRIPCDKDKIAPVRILNAAAGPARFLVARRRRPRWRATKIAIWVVVGRPPSPHRPLSPAHVRSAASPRDPVYSLPRAGLYRYSQYSKVTLLELRKALADLELRLIAMDVEQERLARDVASQDGAARGNGSATAAAPQPFVDVP